MAGLIPERSFRFQPANRSQAVFYVRTRRLWNEAENEVMNDRNQSPNGNCRRNDNCSSINLIGIY